MIDSNMPLECGVPDWQGATRQERVDVLPAYQAPGIVYALSKSICLARHENGKPEFMLEFFYDRNDPDIRNAVYAMLNIAFEYDDAALSMASGLPGDRQASTLLALVPGRATYCHIECGDVRASLPFAWESNRRAVVQARLPVDTANLLYGALATGGLGVLRAAIECEVRGVLPRPACSVHFNAGRVLRALCDILAQGECELPFEAMVNHLERSADELFELTPDIKLTTGIGLALAGRLCQHYGRVASSSGVAQGPRIHFDIPAEDGPALVSWDLRTPLIAGVPVFLRHDVFATWLGPITRDEVCRFTAVAPLPDALRTRRIVVASGLPGRVANANRIVLTVRVDKAFSASGKTERHTVPLYPCSVPSTTLDLRYAKLEGEHPYEARVEIVGNEAVRCGTWMPGTGDFVFIDLSRLPQPNITVHAGQSLLQDAELEFCVMAGEASISAPLTLTPDSPTASLLLSDDTPAGRLVVTVRDRMAPERTLGLDLPCRSVTLDRSAFPAYGSQCVDVSVDFTDALQLLHLEVLPEQDGAEPVLLDLSPRQVHGQLHYFADRLFRNRYRYRASTGNGNGPAPWSELQAPEQALHFTVPADGKPVRTPTFTHQESAHD